MPPIVTPLGNGRFRVVNEGRSVVAYGASDGARTWIFLRGRVYALEPGRSGPARRESARPDDGALSSPMPASVAEIRVAPGDRVSRGDVLITLEAMKMELPIRAPRDGTVRSIGCRPGELVQPGVALVVVE